MPVKVDAREAFRKLNRAKRLIQRKSAETVWELTDLGKYRAKELAPYFSGKTAGMIRAIKRTTSTGQTGIILSPNPQKYYWTENSIVAQKFDGSLVRFLNDPISYRMIIDKKGHRYMFKTINYLNNIKKKVAQGNFNRINLK